METQLSWLIFLVFNSAIGTHTQWLKTRYVSGEGWVEQQQRGCPQITSSQNSPLEPVFPFRRQAGHFFPDMSNRVEHQKRNQPAIEKWPFGFVFGVQLDLRQTQALIKTKKNKLSQVEQLWDKWGAFTAWTPKTKPNGHFSMAVWFRFWCSTRLPTHVG